MSQSTAVYGFIKPDPSEASGPEEIAENMIKTERVLINTELGSATGRNNINMMGFYRNTSPGAFSVNTEGSEVDLLTWNTLLGSSAWSSIYILDENFSTPSLGLSFHYFDGNFEFYHAGYYRVTWNLRVQMSNTTMTEGFVRAALMGTDGFVTRSTDLGILGSVITVPMNTMSNTMDIGTEQLIRVTQLDRSVDGNSNCVTTGKNQREYYENTPLFRYFIIGWAHNNNSSATATPLANESYVHVEFVRGL